MVPTIQSLGIDKLTREQRLALVFDIWDTISDESASSLLNESQAAELLNRAAHDDAAPNDVIDWEAVKAQTLSRFEP